MYYTYYVCVCQYLLYFANANIKRYENAHPGANRIGV